MVKHCATLSPVVIATGSRKEWYLAVPSTTSVSSTNDKLKIPENCCSNSSNQCFHLPFKKRRHFQLYEDDYTNLELQHQQVLVNNEVRPVDVYNATTPSSPQPDKIGSTVDQILRGTSSFQEKKRKRCVSPGCKKMARVGGVCVSHGAQQRKCNFSGCNNIVVNGGLCTKHGAVRNNKKCSVFGCNKEAKKGGICYTHGAKRQKCFFLGCKNVVVKGGACNRHEKELNVVCHPL